MIIAVTGGKGGTGKTSVALSLAMELENVLYIDADVEAPNAALLLGAKMEEVAEVKRKIPHINEEKCIKCGLCAKACPTAALVFIPNRVPLFFEENCLGCMICKDVCPVGAIEEMEEKIGTIRMGETDRIKIYDAMAEPNVEETAPIVSQLLRTALKEQQENVIIDTAAGIHCNVARAIMPADKVVIVTEPTPYGLHDLKKIVKLVKTMEKPFEIYANKWGISEQYGRKIERIAEREGVQLKRIPYSKDFAERYARGKFVPLQVRE